MLLSVVGLSGGTCRSFWRVPEAMIGRIEVVRVVRLLISFFVFVWDRLSEWTERVFRRKVTRVSVVVYYHAVSEKSRARFGSQMDDLIRWTRPIALHTSDLFGCTSHRTAVTFDDGYESVIENALPEMARRGIPATIFMPTDGFGRRPKWVKDRKNPLSKEVVMTVEQLRELKKNQLISIGSHCVTHSNLLLMTECEVKKELNGSRRTLESILDQEIELLSFPHGAYNDRILELAREAGYKRVFSITPKCAFLESSSFVIGRVRVDPTDWPIEFRLKLLGAYRWLAVTPKLKSLVYRLIGKNNGMAGQGGSLVRR